MSCYCSDIRKCNRDIQKIRTTQSYFQRACDCNYRGVKNHLNNLELNHTLCITPDNIDTLADTILHSNDALQQITDSLLATCGREIDKLEEQLSKMEYWDDRYHESDDD